MLVAGGPGIVARRDSHKPPVEFPPGSQRVERTRDVVMSSSLHGSHARLVDQRLVPAEQPVLR